MFDRAFYTGLPRRFAPRNDTRKGVVREGGSRVLAAVRRDRLMELSFGLFNARIAAAVSHRGRVCVLPFSGCNAQIAARSLAIELCQNLTPTVKKASKEVL